MQKQKIVEYGWEGQGLPINFPHFIINSKNFDDTWNNLKQILLRILSIKFMSYNFVSRQENTSQGPEIIFSRKVEE